MNTNQKEKKPILSKLLSITGVLCIVLGITFRFWGPLILPPKVMIQNEVKTVFKSLKTTIHNFDKNHLDYNLEKDSLGIKGNLTIQANSNTSDLSYLNDYKLSYSGAFDQKNNQANLSAALKDSQKDILNIQSFFEGKSAIFDFGTIYDKNVSIELDKEIKDLEQTKSIELDTYLKLLEKTEEITKKYIKEEDITKEKEGKQTKITYTIKTNEYAKYLLSEYAKDDEILKLLNNITGKEQSEIKTTLEEEQNSIDTESTDTLKSILYLESGQTKKIELIASSKNYQEEENQIKIVMDVEGNIYKYHCFENEQEEFHGEYNKSTHTLTYVSENDYYSQTMSLMVKEKDIKFEYATKTSLSTSNILINSTSTTSLNKEKNILTLKYDMTSGENTTSIKISNNLEIEKNVKVTKWNNTKETVKAEEMSQQDLNTLYQNLNTALTSIVEKVPQSNTINSYFRKIIE